MKKPLLNKSINRIFIISILFVVSGYSFYSFAGTATTNLTPTKMNSNINQTNNKTVNQGFGQKDYPPDFKLKILANGSGFQTLYSLKNASVDGVVVAFVASWCGRCKESYPLLEALQKEYGKRLKILLITADTDQEAKNKMVSIVKEKKMTLPLLDPSENLVQLWLGDKKNIPRFFMIDYKGEIRVKDTGFGDKMAKLLPQHIDWLLSRRFEEEK